MLNNRIPILFLKQQERESSENNWGKNNINGFSNNAKIISYCVEINIYCKEKINSIFQVIDFHLLSFHY